MKIDNVRITNQFITALCQLVKIDNVRITNQFITALCQLVKIDNVCNNYKSVHYCSAITGLGWEL